MSAVVVENGFLPIGGTTRLSWSPVDAGSANAPITGAVVTWKLFSEDQAAAEKITEGSGVALDSGTLTETAGVYTGTITPATTLADGTWYVLWFKLVAAGLQDIVFAGIPARYPTASQT